MTLALQLNALQESLSLTQRRVLRYAREHIASFEDSIDRIRLFFLSVQTASKDVICSAITLAQETFQSGVWSKAQAHERSAVLTRMGQLLESRVTDIAEIESMQIGRSIREMSAQLGRLPEWLSVGFALCLQARH